MELKVSNLPFEGVDIKSLGRKVQDLSILNIQVSLLPSATMLKGTAASCTATSFRVHDPQIAFISERARSVPFITVFRSTWHELCFSINRFDKLR